MDIQNNDTLVRGIGSRGVIYTPDSGSLNRYLCDCRGTITTVTGDQQHYYYALKYTLINYIKAGLDSHH